MSNPPALIINPRLEEATHMILRSQDAGYKLKMPCYEDI